MNFQLPTLTTVEKEKLIELVMTGDLQRVRSHVFRMVSLREDEMLPLMPAISQDELNDAEKNGKIFAIIRYRDRNPGVSLSLAKKIWDKAFEE